MVASWHPGESWHRGRRRSGAEAAISPSGVRGPGRSTALTSPHRAHPTPPRPIHSSYPARPTHRPAPPRPPPHSPLSAGADASLVPSGPSSRSLAAPAGAAGGTGGQRRSLGTVSHPPGPRAPAPPSDPSGTRTVPGRVGAAHRGERRPGCGRRRRHAAGTLTQASTSLRADASSSRVGATPGNSSGLGRLLSTAWASERPRATRRSPAHDCGDPAS